MKLNSFFTWEALNYRKQFGGQRKDERLRDNLSAKLLVDMDNFTHGTPFDDHFQYCQNQRLVTSREFSKDRRRELAASRALYSQADFSDAHGIVVFIITVELNVHSVSHSCIRPVLFIYIQYQDIQRFNDASIFEFSTESFNKSIPTLKLR